MGRVPAAAHSIAPVVPARRFPHLLHALWFAVLALAVALVAQAALLSFGLLWVVLALAVVWPLRA